MEFRTFLELEFLEMVESVSRSTSLGVLPCKVLVKGSTTNRGLHFSVEMITGEQFIEAISRSRIADSLSASLDDFLKTRLNLFELILKTDLESVLSYEIKSEAEEEAGAESDEEEEPFPEESEEIEEPPEVEEEEEEPEFRQPPRNLIDYLRTFDIDPNSALKKSIRNYYQSFIKMSRALEEWLPQIIRDRNIDRYNLISCLSDLVCLEVVPIHPETGLIRSVGRTGRVRQKVEILVVLDTHPVRLILLDKRNRKILEGENPSFVRAFIPPVLVRLPKIPKEDVEQWSRVFILGKPLVYHAYRTISQHAAYIVGFCEDGRVNDEIQEGNLSAISNSVWLHSRSKGASFSTSVDTRPRFVTSQLVNLLLRYLEEEPYSRDQLRILDVGSRSGVLVYDVLKRLYAAATEMNLLDELSRAKVVLNDIDEEQLGKGFIRRRSMEEAMYQYSEFFLAPGPAYEVVGRLKQKKFRELLTKPILDVCFLNRLVDMYGTYMIRTVPNKKAMEETTYGISESSSDFNIAGRNILLYDGVTDFNSWYSVMAFILNPDHWLSEMRNVVRLPGVAYDLTTQLLDNRFPFESLAELSELVVISAFPGSCRSIVGFEGQKNSLWATEVAEEALPGSGYKIVLLSKKKKLGFDMGRVPPT